MDKTYWRDFYSKHKVGIEPSLFARFVYENYLLSYTKQGFNIVDSYSDMQSPQETKNTESSTPSLLELGCGNGRDSLYFANQGIDTTAIDQVQEEIEFLNDYVERLMQKDKPLQPDIDDKNVDGKNRDKKAEALSQVTIQKTNVQNTPHFLCGDFTQLDSFNFKQQFDCIYSRFTLHSISKNEQDKTLADCLKYCKEGGILSVEVRGEKNSLYSKGRAVENEPNAFIYDNHYRRFLNFNQTIHEIESLRFSPNNAIQEAFNKKTDNTSNTQSRYPYNNYGGGGI